MAEEEEEHEEPTIELGEDASVDGAPVGRIAARLSWPRGKGAVIDQEGETEIRTAEGPRTLAEILEDVENPYFATRQEFVHGVREVVGYGPVPTTE